MQKTDDFYDTYLDDIGENRESAFSLHPVNWSYELSDDTLLGKRDIHFEERFNYYSELIDKTFEQLKAAGKA